MDGPRDYHPTWSKSERQISYDITYKWNLKNMIQMNLLIKQNKNGFTAVLLKLEEPFVKYKNTYLSQVLQDDWVFWSSRSGEGCWGLLLLLSCFSRVRLCVTPQTAAHQAPPSLGFPRQEHWSGLPFPSPMHGNENWKWSHSVVSDS